MSGNSAAQQSLNFYTLFCSGQCDHGSIGRSGLYYDATNILKTTIWCWTWPTLLPGLHPTAWKVGNVIGLQTCAGWCYRWLQVWVQHVSLHPSLNLCLRHGFDGLLTGLPAFSSQCDRVTCSHGMVFSYHHFHQTFTTHLPAHSQLQPSAHTCPPPSRGMWAGLILLDWGEWQEEHKGVPSKWEAQLVCHENRPMACSCSSLFPEPQLMPLEPTWCILPV